MTCRSLLVLVLVLFAALPGRTMIETLPIPQLVRESELIVLGEVERQTDLPGLAPTGDEKKPTHATGAPRALPRVESVVKPVRVLKGKVQPGQQLTFVTLGAVSGQPWFEDEPRFPPVGRRVLLFLRNGKSGLEPVNLIQGVWPLDPSHQKLQGMGFGYSLEDIATEIRSQRQGGK